MSDQPDGRALAERLRAERDERRRLAEQIHDGPVQLVAAIAQMLDAAQQAQKAGDSASVGAIVDRALDIAREASVDLREIVSGIEPLALHERGLAAAVAELADRHAHRRGIAFELDLVAGDTLGDGARSGVYQIIRYALDQAVRRGPPHRITVALRDDAGGVALQIADDGKPERREAVLAALRERADELNAAFACATDEQGTRLSVRLPPSAARL